MSSRWLLWMVSLLFTVNVNALNVIPQVASDGTRAHVLEEQGFIELAPANASGISYNKFHLFDQETSPLRILNARSDAHLIVFEAPDFILDSDIELIGKSADIVFLSQRSDSYISCEKCSFNAFTRVTLAAASVDGGLPASSGQLGDLTTSGGGQVFLDGLYAPDALIVETVSNYLDVVGQNSTVRQVSQDANGGFVADDSGLLTLSGGSVHFNVGELHWNYETRSLVKAAVNHGKVSIKGTLESPEVKIFSTRVLDIAADIKTNVDVLSSAQYRGDVLVPSGNISITSTSALPVNIRSELNSSGSINITSGGSVLIDETSSIESEYIHIVAARDFINHGDVAGNTIAVSADKALNRGVVKAERLAKIEGESFVGNEFGGEISAETVRLVSDAGLIRNGSRTPYMTQSSQVYSTISDHTPFLNPSGIEGGMYYATRHDEITDKVKAESTKAMIHGNDVYIESVAIENINPYWVPIDYQENVGDADDGVTVHQGVVNVDREIGNGVSISSINDLKIHGKDYVYNSSGIIETSTPNSVLEIAGAIVINERYRRMNLLGEKSYYPGKLLLNGQTIRIDKKDDYSRNFYTLSHVFSAPGRVFASGKMRVLATSSVINNISYIETLSDLKIESSNIRQIGHENRKYNVFKLYGQGSKSDNEGVDVTTHESMDALFKVGGYLYASKSAFIFNNTDELTSVDALSEYAELAANRYVSKVYHEIDRKAVSVVVN